MSKAIKLEALRDLKAKIERCQVVSNQRGDWYSKKEVDAVLVNFVKFLKPKKKVEK